MSCLKTKGIKSVSSSEELKQILSQPPTHTFFDKRIILCLKSDTVYEINNN